MKTFRNFVLMSGLLLALGACGRKSDETSSADSPGDAQQQAEPVFVQSTPVQLAVEPSIKDTEDEKAYKAAQSMRAGREHEVSGEMIEAFRSYYEAALLEPAVVTDAARVLNHAVPTLVKQGSDYIDEVVSLVDSLNRKYPGSRELRTAALHLYNATRVEVRKQFNSNVRFSRGKYEENPFGCTDLFGQVEVMYKLAILLGDKPGEKLWGAHYADAMLAGDFCEGNSDDRMPAPAYALYSRIGDRVGMQKAALVAAEMVMYDYAYGAHSDMSGMAIGLPLDSISGANLRGWLKKAGWSNARIESHIRHALVKSARRLEQTDESYAAGMVYSHLGDTKNARRMQLLAPDPPSFEIPDGRPLPSNDF